MREMLLCCFPFAEREREVDKQVVRQRKPHCTLVVSK